MLHAPGTDPAPLRALIDEGIAGVILMGDNMPADEASLAELTKALQADPEAATLIGIDEEGGSSVAAHGPPGAAPAVAARRAAGIARRVRRARRRSRHPA